MRFLLIASLVIQFVAITVAMFVPFGFDHPSSWGLGFFHFLWLLVAHFNALVMGIFSAIILRHYIVAVGQLVVTAFVVGLVYMGVISL